MKTHILLPLGLAVGLAVLAGCTTAPPVENAPVVDQRIIVADPRVSTDASLNNLVSVMGVRTSMTPGGLLKVQVELQNRTTSLQQFIYRFEWFDANGMEINNVITAPITDQIESQEDKFIFSIAPNPNCKDFRVKFITAN
jgi:uncharacterized protein YcfL